MGPRLKYSLVGMSSRIYIRMQLTRERTIPMIHEIFRNRGQSGPWISSGCASNISESNGWRFG